MLNEPISQGGFPMIDVGDDRKIANMFHSMLIKTSIGLALSMTGVGLFRRLA
jgi:hypothetical protein